MQRTFVLLLACAGLAWQYGLPHANCRLLGESELVPMRAGDIKYCATCYGLATNECAACLDGGNNGKIRCDSNPDTTWQNCHGCIVMADFTTPVCAGKAYHYQNQQECSGPDYTTDTCYRTHSNCTWAGLNPPGVNCP